MCRYTATMSHPSCMYLVLPQKCVRWSMQSPRPGALPGSRIAQTASNGGDSLPPHPPLHPHPPHPPATSWKSGPDTVWDWLGEAADEVRGHQRWGTTLDAGTLNRAVVRERCMGAVGTPLDAGRWNHAVVRERCAGVGLPTKHAGRQPASHTPLAGVH